MNYSEGETDEVIGFPYVEKNDLEQYLYYSFN